MKNIWVKALAITFAVAVVCVSGFILIHQMISREPKDAPTEAVAVQTPTMQNGEDAGENHNEDSNVLTDNSLIGLWSTEGASGELVDPATGMATGSVYNGEWYLFRDDGTFRYVIIGSGQVLNGGVVWEGKYTVTQEEIKLTSIKESWYPNPAATGQKEAYENKRTDNTILQYALEDDGKTLVINEADHYTRVEE